MALNRNSSKKYEMVVDALSEKKGGFTREDIIDRVGISSGGGLTKILNNLVLSGFVRVTGFYWIARSAGNEAGRRKFYKQLSVRSE